MTTTSLSNDDDTYAALTAGETVFALGGNDKVSAHDGGSLLYGGDGNDTLNGGLGDDYLQGDDFNNFNGLNILNGDAGDDYINSNSDRDVIDAGTGNDTVEMLKIGAGQVVKGGTGQDRLELTGLEIKAFVTIDMASSFTAIVNGADSATFKGFESLSYTGGAGRSDISCADGDDHLIINNGAAAFFKAGTLDSGGGDDSFIITGVTEDFVEQVDGGTGEDGFNWQQGASAITNLTVNAGAGTMADGGSQFLTFSSMESVFVNASNLLGSLNYQGFGGVDGVTFNGVSAIINTGGGNDSISVGQGKATVQAGAGNDSVNVSTTNDSKVDVSGGDGDDTLSGGGKARILGESGDDNMSAIGSRCSLFGGTGEDSLSLNTNFADAASSSATIDGGGGTDTLTLTLGSTSFTLRADFSQTIVTFGNGLTVTGCEIINYNGGFGIDIITSSANANGAKVNIVSGGSGNDKLTAADAGATLDGGFGDDELKGGTGNDILKGGFGGNDSLVGGSGKDLLTGGIGRDTMQGGLDADRFIYTYWAESGTTELTRDVISDFKRAQGDKIDLSGIDAVNTTVGVDEAFKFAGSAFTGKAGQLIVQKFDNTGTANDYTLISGDITGAGAANFTIEVRGLVDFKATDFFL
jgi:Ca2+-binding RTX toxin-like protein